MVQYFKKSLSYKKRNALLISLLFSSTNLYSAQNPENSAKKEKNEVLFIPKFGYIVPPFWETLKQTTIITTSNGKVSNSQIYKNYSQALHYLYIEKTQDLFREHFFNAFDQIFDNHKDKSDLVTDLIDTLKNKSSEEIKKFTENYNFTTTDKILTLMALISNNRPDINIFDFMESINLSPNDHVSFKDIQSQFIEEDLRNSEDVMIVVSHLLVNTGKLEVIEKLLSSKDHDPNIKNQMGDNILHSAIRFNSLLKLNEINSDYKEILYSLARHSQQIINDKNINGDTPLALAVRKKDKVAIEILLDTNFSADLHTVNNLNENLKEIAKKTKDEEIINYLDNHLPQNIKKEALIKEPLIKEEKNQASFEISFLNFEDFIAKIAVQVYADQNKLFIDQNEAALEQSKATPEQNDNFHNFFKDLSSNLNTFENIRLVEISALFNANKTENEQFISTLKAIYLRDAQFFDMSHSNSSLIKEPLRLVSHQVSIPNFILGQEPTTFVTNPLMEAIRNSFLPAIEPLIKINKNLKQDLYSLSFDPLSLALLIYASLKENDPLKADAKEIINLIASSVNVEEPYVFPVQIQIKPIYIAVILGLLEEVKFLHEEKGAELKTNINLLNVPVDLLEYTKSQYFMQLNHYLKTVQLKSLGISSCEKIFIN